MAIVFPPKDSKILSQYKDALRILAWSEYKRNAHSELSGLDLYQLFKKEWEAHEIQSYSLNKVKDLIKNLGYSEAEISNIRREYYEKRKESQERFSQDETPF